ncbi:MAG TPA: hypothetical protein DGH68_12595 [Bacteroidetes bacterium]|nr:hypothetical protein [Bacteroidota bacterium]
MFRNASSLLLLALIPTSLAWSQQERELIEFFPGEKIFPSFTADPLTHQISLSHIMENREWIGTLGGSIPLAQVNLEGAEVQISVAGSTFNRLITPPGLTVYTIDYKVDFPLDVRVSETAFRFALGHYSCHFADDGIELLGKHSIQYIKDYVMLGVAQDIPLIGGHVYFAGHWAYHNVPIQDKNWALQFGFEAGNVSVHQFVQLYCAVDLKLKQEVSWGSTQSYQIGARLFARGTRALRIAYTLRRGFDERGQFFDQHEDANIISAFIDF